MEGEKNKIGDEVAQKLDGSELKEENQLLDWNNNQNINESVLVEDNRLFDWIFCQVIDKEEKEGEDYPQID